MDVARSIISPRNFSVGVNRSERAILNFYATFFFVLNDLTGVKYSAVAQSSGDNEQTAEEWAFRCVHGTQL